MNKIFFWLQVIKANLVNPTQKGLTGSGSKTKCLRSKPWWVNLASEQLESWLKFHPAFLYPGQSQTLPSNCFNSEGRSFSLLSLQTGFLHVIGSMSTYIPKCLSSTAFARRKELSSFLSFSFRNPRERLWLAQFGPDTHPFTNQQWPGECGRVRCETSHRTTWREQRCGQSPESECTAPKRQWCGAGHKE